MHTDQHALVVCKCSLVIAGKSPVEMIVYGNFLSAGLCFQCKEEYVFVFLVLLAHRLLHILHLVGVFDSSLAIKQFSWLGQQTARTKWNTFFCFLAISYCFLAPNTTANISGYDHNQVPHNWKCLKDLGLAYK